MTRFLLPILLVVLTACTSPDKVHRALPPSDPLCGDVLDLGAANFEPARKKNNPARCFLQTHKMPDVEGEDDAQPQTWAEIAAEQGRPLTQADQFTLSFVELHDDGTLQQPEQLTALRDRLEDSRRQGRQRYVIAFVHGWRHDAALRDNDVKKFRILLGYARSALNARCVAEGQYCKADLTGVFIGWRGRLVAEPVLATDGKFSPFALIAAPSLWNRKDRSEALGTEAALGHVLQSVQDTLDLDTTQSTADKYLIMGHSLGGNMLASLMEQRVLDAIGNHSAPVSGQEGVALAPPLGDLVVLMNPAAEARKWTTLQSAMRTQAGLPADNNKLEPRGPDGEIDWELWSKLRPWRQLFPVNQRPVYVSITSTRDWSSFETGGRKVAYDTATGFLFPLAQRLKGQTAPTEQRTIGHLSPDYATQKSLNGPAIGSSHELSVNKGTGSRASYRLSAQPRQSWCDPATGWLTTVRDDQKAAGWSYSDGWDYGLTPKQSENRSRAAANIARGYNEASVQWRHSLNLKGKPNRWSVVSGRSPFWNVRALDTAVRDHAGYVNYPMWCALNQLVLDDVTSGGQAAPVVERVQKAESLVESSTTKKKEAPAQAETAKKDRSKD